jgi:ribosomal protein L11 methyltransferase
MPRTSGLWRVFVTAPDAAAAEAAARALEPALVSVSAFEAGNGAWLIEGLSVARPDEAALETNLALAWLGLGSSPPALVIERIAARDWLAENWESFPAITVGRFVIHGSGRRPPARDGRIALTIDAATAFGTGEHASTRGCLLALDALARRRRFVRVLDMGTGTGILAMAAARNFHAAVALYDIDPEAVRVARANAAANGLKFVLAPARAGAFGTRALRRRAPFDLVLANILARPLMAMARGLSATLAPHGFAVLSGLLPWQEASVLAAYRRVRLALAARIVVDGWSTLVLARGDRLPLSLTRSRGSSP